VFLLLGGGKNRGIAGGWGGEKEALLPSGEKKGGRKGPTGDRGKKKKKLSPKKEKGRSSSAEEKEGKILFL